jgi:hypothetical protein
MVMKSMTTDIEIAVDVAKPANVVFQYFTDWPRQGEWMMGTRVEARADGTRGFGQGEGAVIAGFTGIGPLGFWDTMTITHWVDDERVDVLHTGRVVRGTGSMYVERVSDSTCRFVWSEQLDLPLGWIGRLGFGLVRPLFIAAIRHSLKKFARSAEAL